MASSALQKELLRNRLTHCYYLELQCYEHGKVRVATQASPSELFFPCPVCKEMCGCTVVGEGGTQRLLPFWDALRDPSFSFDESVALYWRGQKAKHEQRALAPA